MDRLKHSMLFRTISVILILTFVTLDISYAYPPEHNPGNSTLATPSLLQQQPVDDHAARFRQSVFHQGALLASIFDIGEFYFRKSGSDAKTTPSKHAEEVISADLGKVLGDSGIEILNIVPVEELKADAGKLREALDEIGFKGTLPEEGVIFVLYKKDGKRFLIQIARKGSVSSANLPGYEWAISDKYLVKYMTEDYVEAVSKITGSERAAINSQGQVIMDFLASRQAYDAESGRWTAIADEDALLAAGPYDAMLVLGSSDERVPVEAAGLAKKLRGINPGMSVITSGKWGTHAGAAGIFFDETGRRIAEAVHYKSLMGALGAKVDITEERSQNSGQNITFSRDELLSRDIRPKSILVIQTPALQLRAGRSAELQYPPKGETLRSMGVQRLTSYAPYVPKFSSMKEDEKAISSAGLVLLELRRCREYSGKFMTQVEIPSAVEDAERALWAIPAVISGVERASSPAGDSLKATGSEKPVEQNAEGVSIGGVDGEDSPSIAELQQEIQDAQAEIDALILRRASAVDIPDINPDGSSRGTSKYYIGGERLDYIGYRRTLTSIEDDIGKLRSQQQYWAAMITWIESRQQEGSSGGDKPSPAALESTKPIEQNAEGASIVGAYGKAPVQNRLMLGFSQRKLIMRMVAFPALLTLILSLGSFMFPVIRTQAQTIEPIPAAAGTVAMPVDTNEINRLIAGIDLTYDDEKLKDIENALEKIGKPAESYLVDAIKDNKYDSRYYFIYRILGDLRSRAALPMILERLSTTCPEEAVKALDKICDETDVYTLISLLNTTSNSELGEAIIRKLSRFNGDKVLEAAISSLGAHDMYYPTKLAGLLKTIKEPVGPRLVEVLKSGSPAAKTHALIMIREVGYRGEAIEVVRSLLQTGDSGIIDDVIETLGELKDEGAVGPLLFELKKERAFLAHNVEEALEKILGKEKAIILMEGGSFIDGDINKKKVAKLRLSGMGTSALRSVTELLENDDFYVRRYAIGALGAIDVDGSIQMLAGILKKKTGKGQSAPDSNSTRFMDMEADAAAEMLAMKGASAGAAVKDVLAGDDAQARHYAIRVLSRIEGRKTSLELLIERLRKDPVGDNRARAAIELGKLRSESAVPALKESLKNDPDERVQAAIKDALRAMPNYKSPFVVAMNTTGRVALVALKASGITLACSIALGAVSLLVVRVFFSVNWLILRVWLSNYKTRDKIAESAAKAGVPIVPGLIKLFRSRRYYAQSTAREAVIKIGEPAADHLIPLLQSSDDELKSEAVHILAKIRSKRAVPSLTAFLSSRDKKVVLSGIDALRKIGDDSVTEAFVGQLGNEDRDIANSAAWGLSELKWEARSAEEKLSYLVAKRDLDGLAALGEVGLDPILDILETADDKKYSEIFDALAKVGQPAIAVLKALAESGNKEQRIHAIKTLKKMGVEGVTDLFVSLVKADDKDISAAGIEALGEIKDAKLLPVYFGALRNAVRQDISNYNIGSHPAFKAMVAMPSQAEKLLVQMLEDDDLLSRQAAAYALNKFRGSLFYEYNRDEKPKRQSLLFGIAMSSIPGIRKISGSDAEGLVAVKKLEALANSVDKDWDRSFLLDHYAPDVIAASSTISDLNILLDLALKISARGLESLAAWRKAAKLIAKTSGPGSDLKSAAQFVEALLSRIADNEMDSIIEDLFNIAGRVAKSSDDAVKALEMLEDYMMRLSEKGVDLKTALEYGLPKIEDVGSFSELKEYLAKYPELNEEAIIRSLIDKSGKVRYAGDAEFTSSYRMTYSELAETADSKVKGTLAWDVDIDLPERLLVLAAGVVTEDKIADIIGIFKAIESVIQQRRRGSAGDGEGGQRRSPVIDEAQKKHETQLGLAIEQLGRAAAGNSAVRAGIVSFLSEIVRDNGHTDYERQVALKVLTEISAMEAKAALLRIAEEEERVRIALYREVRLPERCSKRYAIKKISGYVLSMVGSEAARREYKDIESTVSLLFEQNPGFIDFLRIYPLRLFSYKVKSVVDAIVFGEYKHYWMRLWDHKALRKASDSLVWQCIRRTIEVTEGSPVDMGIAVELFKNRYLLSGVVRHEYLHHKGILSEGEVFLRQIDYMKSLIADAGLNMADAERRVFEEAIGRALHDTESLTLGIFLTSTVGAAYLNMLNKHIVSAYGPDRTSIEAVSAEAEKIIGDTVRFIEIANMRIGQERKDERMFEPLSEGNKEKIGELVQRSKSVINTLSQKRFAAIQKEDGAALEKWARYKAAGGARVLEEVITGKPQAGAMVSGIAKKLIATLIVALAPSLLLAAESATGQSDSGTISSVIMALGASAVAFFAIWRLLFPKSLMRSETAVEPVDAEVPASTKDADIAVEKPQSAAPERVAEAAASTEDKDIAVFKDATNLMYGEPGASVRALNSNGRPGQLFSLEAERLIVIGDLHTEPGALDEVTARIDRDGDLKAGLRAGSTKIILVGDIVSSMNRGDYRRYRDIDGKLTDDEYNKAYDEYARTSGERAYAILARLAALKREYPDGIFILPGNGELDFGRKKASAEFYRLFTGEDKKVLPAREGLYKSVRDFIDSMPYFAMAKVAGKNCLISHGAVVYAPSSKRVLSASDPLRSLIDAERDGAERPRLRADGSADDDTSGDFWRFRQFCYPAVAPDNLKFPDYKPNGGVIPLDSIEDACARYGVNYQVSGHMHLFGTSQKENSDLGITIEDPKIAYAHVGDSLHVVNSMALDNGYAYLEITRDSLAVRTTAPRPQSAVSSPGEDTTAKTLSESLHDSDFWVRRSAAEALAKRGSPSLEHLIKALGGTDPDVRFSAAWGLGYLKDIRALEHLIKALSDRDPLVRHGVALALGNTEDVRAIEPLIRAMGDSDPSVRRGAAWGLGKIRDPRAVGPLAKLLGDDDYLVRFTAADALVKIGPPALEPLITAADDPDIDISSTAEEALVKMGVRTKKKEPTSAAPQAPDVVKSIPETVKGDPETVRIDGTQAGATPVDGIDREIKARGLEAYGDFYDTPQDANSSKEGPTLKHDLQAMLEMLNDLDAYAGIVPNRYRNILAENRDFFVWFILLHDIGMKAARAKNADGKGIGHEIESVKIIERDSILAGITVLDDMKKMVRLHMSIFGRDGISPPSLADFMRSAGLDERLMEMLIAAHYLDLKGARDERDSAKMKELVACMDELRVLNASRSVDSTISLVVASLREETDLSAQELFALVQSNIHPSMKRLTAALEDLKSLSETTGLTATAISAGIAQAREKHGLSGKETQILWLALTGLGQGIGSWLRGIFEQNWSVKFKEWFEEFKDVEENYSPLIPNGESVGEYLERIIFQLHKENLLTNSERESWLGALRGDAGVEFIRPESPKAFAILLNIFFSISRKRTASNLHFNTLTSGEPPSLFEDIRYFNDKLGVDLSFSYTADYHLLLSYDRGDLDYHSAVRKAAIHYISLEDGYRRLSLIPKANLTESQRTFVNGYKEYQRDVESMMRGFQHAERDDDAVVKDARWREALKMQIEGYVGHRLYSVDPVTAVIGASAAAYIFNTAKDLILAHPAIAATATLAIGIAAAIAIWRTCYPVSWHLFRMKYFDFDGTSVRALTKMGSPVVPDLIKALSDRSPIVRQGVAKALGNIGDARAISPLINMLSDNDSWTRSISAGALGRIGTAAIEPLIEALRNPDPDVRSCVALSLNIIGLPALDALVRSVNKALSNPGSAADEALVKSAIGVLLALGSSLKKDLWRIGYERDNMNLDRLLYIVFRADFDAAQAEVDRYYAGFPTVASNDEPGYAGLAAGYKVKERVLKGFDYYKELAAYLARTEVQIISLKEKIAQIDVLIKDRRVIELLTKGLSDSDPRDRRNNAMALIESGDPRLSSMQNYLSLIAKGRSDIRPEELPETMAGEVRAKRQIEHAIWLMANLINADPGTRESAVKGLGKLGPAAAYAVPALAEAFLMRPELSSLIAEALGEIGPAAIGSVPALMKALEDDMAKGPFQEDAYFRRRIMKALDKIGVLTRELRERVYAKDLEFRTNDIRESAESGLRELGAFTPELRAIMLVAEYRYGPVLPRFRDSVVSDLADVGPITSGVVSTLIKGLTCDQRNARNIALNTLKGWGALTPELEAAKYIVDYHENRHNRGCDSHEGDTGADFEAIRALGRIGNIRAALTEESIQIGLGQYAGSGVTDRVIDTINMALRDSNRDVRAAAEEALRNIKSSSGDVSLENLKPTVRGPQTGAVSSVAKKLATAIAVALVPTLLFAAEPATSQQGVDILYPIVACIIAYGVGVALFKLVWRVFFPVSWHARTLDNGYPSSAYRAATESLVKIGSKRAVLALIKEVNKEALKASTNVLLPYIIEALGKIGDKRVVPALIDCLGSNDSEVVSDAAKVLVKICDDRVVPALKNMLRDDRVSVRRSVAESLDKVGWKANTEGESIDYAIAKMDWARVVTLGQPAVPALIECLRSYNTDLCRSATETLAKIGHPAIPALKEALKDAKIRDSAALALAKIGLPAVIALVEALSNPDASVRSAAARALFEIKDARLYFMKEYLELMINPGLGSYTELSDAETAYIVDCLKNDRDIETQFIDYVMGPYTSPEVVDWVPGGEMEVEPAPAADIYGLDEYNARASRGELRMVPKYVPVTSDFVKYKVVSPARLIITPVSPQRSVPTAAAQRIAAQYAPDVLFWTLDVSQADLPREKMVPNNIGMINDVLYKRSWMWGHLAVSEEDRRKALEKIASVQAKIPALVTTLYANGIISAEGSPVSAYLMGSFPWAKSPNDADIVLIVEGNRQFSRFQGSEFVIKLEEMAPGVETSIEVVGLETLKRAAKGEEFDNAKVIRRKLIAYSGAVPLAGFDIFRAHKPPIENYHTMLRDLITNAELVNWPDLKGEVDKVEAKKRWRRKEAEALMAWINKQPAGLQPDFASAETGKAANGSGAEKRSAAPQAPDGAKGDTAGPNSAKKLATAIAVALVPTLLFAAESATGQAGTGMALDAGIRDALLYFALIPFICAVALIILITVIDRIGPYYLRTFFPEWYRRWYLHRLDNGKGHIRFNAATMLREIGWKPATDEETISHLIALLDGGGYEAYTAAQVKLEKMGSAAVPKLIKALTSTKIGLAAEILGNIGDPRAVEPLRAAMYIGDHYLVARAAKALGKIGDADSEEALIWALATLNVRKNNMAPIAKAILSIDDPRLAPIRGYLECISDFGDPVYYPGFYRPLTKSQARIIIECLRQGRSFSAQWRPVVTHQQAYEGQEADSEGNFYQGSYTVLDNPATIMVQLDDAIQPQPAISKEDTKATGGNKVHGVIGDPRLSKEKEAYLSADMRQRSALLKDLDETMSGKDDRIEFLIWAMNEELSRAGRDNLNMNFAGPIRGIGKIARLDTNDRESYLKIKDALVDGIVKMSGLYGQILRSGISGSRIDRPVQDCRLSISIIMEELFRTCFVFERGMQPKDAELISSEVGDIYFPYTGILKVLKNRGLFLSLIPKIMDEMAQASSRLAKGSAGEISGGIPLAEVKNGNEGFIGDPSRIGLGHSIDFPEYRDHLVRWIEERFGRSLSILSVGAGRGGLEVALQTKGHKVTAIEYEHLFAAEIKSRYSKATGERELEVIEGDARVILKSGAAIGEGRKFDLVIFSESAGTIGLDAVKDAGKLLGEGGSLLVIDYGYPGEGNAKLVRSQFPSNRIPERLLAETVATATSSEVTVDKTTFAYAYGGGLVAFYARKKDGAASAGQETAINPGMIKEAIRKLERGPTQPIPSAASPASNDFDAAYDELVRAEIELKEADHLGARKIRQEDIEDFGIERVRGWHERLRAAKERHHKAVNMLLERARLEEVVFSESGVPQLDKGSLICRVDKDPAQNDVYRFAEYDPDSYVATRSLPGFSISLTGAAVNSDVRMEPTVFHDRCKAKEIMRISGPKDKATDILGDGPESTAQGLRPDTASSVAKKLATAVAMALVPTAAFSADSAAALDGMELHILLFLINAPLVLIAYILSRYDLPDVRYIMKHTPIFEYMSDSAPIVGYSSIPVDEENYAGKNLATAYGLSCIVPLLPVYVTLRAVYIIISRLWRIAVGRIRIILKKSGITNLPFIVAHRGGYYEGVRPNSLEAVRRSIALGVDAVEFDVQMTGDGQLVVHHEEYLGDKRMDYLTLVEARKMQPDLATIEEIYGVLGDKARMHIHVVWTKGINEKLIETLAGFIESHGLIGRSLVISFYPGDLKMMSKHCPGSDRCLIFQPGFLIDVLVSDEKVQPLFDAANEADARYVTWPRQVAVDRAVITALKQRGLSIDIGVGSIETPTGATSLLRYGADILTIDNPQMIVGALPKKNSPLSGIAKKLATAVAVALVPTLLFAAEPAVRTYGAATIFATAKGFIAAHPVVTALIALGIFMIISYRVNKTGSYVLIQKIVRAGREGSPELQARYVQEMALLGQDAAPALAQSLADSDETRRSALKVLRVLDPEGSGIGFFIETLENKNPYVRFSAAQGIGHMGALSGLDRSVSDMAISMIPRLLAMTFSDENGRVQHAAGYAVLELGKKAIPTLIELLSNEDPGYRRSALITFGNMRSEAVEALPEIERMLQDSDADVRQTAREAIEMIGSPQANTSTDGMAQPAASRAQPGKIFAGSNVTELAAIELAVIDELNEGRERTAQELFDIVRFKIPARMEALTAALEDLVPLSRGPGLDADTISSAITVAKAKHDLSNEETHMLWLALTGPGQGIGKTEAPAPAAAPERKKITIVTANYNNDRHTDEFLRSLERVDYPNYEVVIVDDGSEVPFKFDPERFKGLPPVTVITNRKNEGISKARNIGIAYALEKGCDYIYFADNDTVMQPDTLDALEREASRRPGAGILGGQELFYDRPSVFYSAGGSRLLWFPRGYGQLNVGQFDNPMEAYAVGSAAMLVKREVFEKVGGFDSDLFFGLEDAEFCLQARRTGLKSVVTPKAKVLHKVGGGMARFSRQRIYYVTRNPLIMAGRFGGLLGIGLILRAMMVSFRSAFGIVKSGDLGAFSEIFRAVIDGLTGREAGRGARGIDNSILSSTDIDIRRYEMPKSDPVRQAEEAAEVSDAALPAEAISPEEAAKPAQPEARQHSGATRLFDIVESALKGKRSEFVKAGNLLISSVDSGKIGAIEKEMATSEIMDRIRTAMKVAEEIKAEPADPEMKARIESLRKGLGQFEADGAVASLIVLARRAKRVNEKLIIALETDWIPAINNATSLQRSAITALMKEIDSIGAALKSMELDNVIVIRGKSDELASNIIKECKDKKTSLRNVVVMASSGTIESDSFRSLRNVDEAEKPFLAGIDPTELVRLYAEYGESVSGQLHIRLASLLYITLELAAGKEPPNIPVIVSYDKRSRRVIFLPKAEPMDYEKLKSTYRAETAALSAA